MQSPYNSPNDNMERNYNTTNSIHNNKWGQQLKTSSYGYLRSTPYNAKDFTEEDQMKDFKSTS